MTQHCDIILWIAIVVFMVPSAHSALPKNMKGVCYKNISVPRPRNVSYIETYKFEYICWFGTKTCYSTGYRTVYKMERQQTQISHRKCCDGYEKKNGTCEPKCSSKCPNGYCARPENCACNYGWSGEFCNEPLVCYIANLDQIDYTKTVSEGPLLKNVKNSTENFLTGWEKLPKCKWENSCQVDSEIIGSTRLGNMTYYFVPINASCNTVATVVKDVRKYGILIVAVTGATIILLIVACIVYIVPRRRKRISRKSNVDGDMTELLIYDTVHPEQIYDHKVTDSTRISDYGYINPELIHNCNVTGTLQICGRNIVGTEMARDHETANPCQSKSRDLVDGIKIGDNGYMDFRPISKGEVMERKQISEYDYVYAWRTRKYDDVNQLEQIRNYHDVCTPPNKEYINSDAKLVEEYDYVCMKKNCSSSKSMRLMLNPCVSRSRDLVDRKKISDNGYVDYKPISKGEVMERKQISEYDYVYAWRTREYDDVNLEPIRNNHDVCTPPNKEYVDMSAGRVKNATTSVSRKFDHDIS